jgi:urease accessory protein
VSRSDLLVINKIDLASFTGADLDLMDREARELRGDRPVVFTSLKSGAGIDDVILWIQREVLFEDAALRPFVVPGPRLHTTNFRAHYRSRNSSSF